MFSTKLSMVSFVRANIRSGLLSKSVGATAGNHNLRPLSNHTNYTNYTILSGGELVFFSLPFLCGTVYIQPPLFV